MSRIALTVVVHVSNVWQTCEWYHRVFAIDAEINPDATWADLHVAGQRLAFASYASQTETFGPRQLNSFLDKPAAVHLDLVVADVCTSFDHALANGAVPVLAPIPNALGQLHASIRDLNGVLVHLIQFPQAELAI